MSSPSTSSNNNNGLTALSGFNIMKTRKIIQICTDSQPTGEDWNAWSVVTALCDDGTTWELVYNFKSNNQEWRQLIEIPQDDKNNQ